MNLFKRWFAKRGMPTSREALRLFVLDELSRFTVGNAEFWHFADLASRAWDASLQKEITEEHVEKLRTWTEEAVAQSASNGRRLKAIEARCAVLQRNVLALRKALRAALPEVR